MMPKPKVKATRSVISSLFLFSLHFLSSLAVDSIISMFYFCALPRKKPLTISSSSSSSTPTAARRPVQLLTSSSVFFIVFLILLTGPIYPVSAENNLEENDICQQLNPCACRLTNGSGVISLHDVSFYNGNPRFIISLSEGISLAYNPCVGFTLKPDVSFFLGLLKKEIKGDLNEQGEEYCTDAAVCKFPTSGNSLQYYNLGKPDTAKFEFDQNENKLLIRYISPDLSFITKVYLVCNKIDQLSIKEESNNSLSLNLQTVCACPNGCHSVMNTFSPGTYIIIVFTSVLLSYLILGILYKKIIHSAEGKELIPNRESWTSFFSLVKDGYLFFISPCLGNTVEYRHYQKL